MLSDSGARFAQEQRFKMPKSRKFPVLIDFSDGPGHVYRLPSEFDEKKWGLSATLRRSGKYFGAPRDNSAKSKLTLSPGPDRYNTRSNMASTQSWKFQPRTRDTHDPVERAKKASVPGPGAYEEPRTSTGQQLVTGFRNQPRVRMRLSNTRMGDVTRQARGKPGPGQYSPESYEVTP